MDLASFFRSLLNIFSFGGSKEPDPIVEDIGEEVEEDLLIDPDLNKDEMPDEPTLRLGSIDPAVETWKEVLAADD